MKKLAGVLIFVLTITMYMVLGGITGFVMVEAFYNVFESGSILVPLLGFVAIYVSIFICMFAQTIIHEGGHLIFGLLTGYGFCSFRVGRYTIIKEDKLTVRKMNIPGTMGQCLMSPPEIKDGKYPFVLYNLGGVILNVVFAVIFFIMAYISSNIIAYLFFTYLAVIGCIFAISNGIPAETKMISNDGYNAVMLSKNKNAVSAFFNQLLLVKEQSSGKRLREMPAEWFTVPDYESMIDTLTASPAIFAANRMMDEHNFSSAAEIIDGLFENDIKMSGLYKNLLICDRIYCELILSGKSEKVSQLRTKSFVKASNKLVSLLSVLRYQYTYALLADGDEKAAEKYKKLFERMAKKYPYPSEVESERELIAICDDTYASITK